MQERRSINVPPREAGDWDVGALAQIGLERARLMSVGVMAEGSVGFGSQAEVALSGGYRYTPGGSALTIHAIPARVLTGWRVGAPNSVVLGGSAVLEAKIVQGDVRKVVLGATLGPYAGIAVRMGQGVMWLARIHFDVRVLRQRYVVSGDEIAEQPLAASMITGFVWN